MALHEKYMEPSDALKKFVSHWEKGGQEDLSDCVVKEPFAYFGPFGNAYELQSLAGFLSLPERGPEARRMETANDIALICGDTAYQYSAMTAFFSEGSRHIAFGGSFANTLVKTQEGWKLETIRFELRSDDSEKVSLDENGRLLTRKGSGDFSLLSGWKKAADRAGRFLSPAPGQAEPVILAETDAPWLICPREAASLPDEEAVRGLFSAFCFGYDFSSMLLIKNILSEESSLETWDGLFWGRDIIAYLRRIRQTKFRTFHAGKFDAVDIKGSGAKALVTLLEPDNFRMEKAEKDLLSGFSGRHLSYTAEKKDGIWKLQKIAVK